MATLRRDRGRTPPLTDGALPAASEVGMIVGLLKIMVRFANITLQIIALLKRRPMCRYRTTSPDGVRPSDDPQ